jgi:hypothetical protein
VLGASTETASSTGDPRPAAAGRWAGRPGPRRDLLVPIAVAVAVVPLLVAAWRLLVSIPGDVYLTGDLASTELRTRDVGHRLLYVGPYSRDGWYHPGPLLYYVLAVPYRLLGSSGAALAAAALAVNGVSVAGMGLVARRRGGTGLALVTLVGCAVLLHALGPEFLAMPWNPHLTVLPYGLLLYLLWALVCGDRWALPGATVVGTFVVQTHVGYVVLAVPVFVAAVGWTVAAALAGRRARGVGPETGEDDDPAGPKDPADPASPPPPVELRALAAPGLVALALGVVLWLGPLIDQLARDRRNLGRILDWFRDSGEEARTLLEGWRVVADQYAWLPEWITGQGPLTITAEPAAVYERVVPVLLVAVLVGAPVACWRRGRPARALTAVWLLASVAGVVATARTLGLLYAYRLHWAWVLGMIGGVLVLWAAWAAAVDAWAWGGRVLAVGALIGLSCLTVASSVHAARQEAPVPEAARLVEGLGGDVRARLDERPGDGPVFVRMRSFADFGPGLGLVLDLERHGVDVVVENEGIGDQRTATAGQPVRAVIEIAVDTEIAAAAEQPGAERIAFAGDPDLEAVAADLAARADIAAQMSAGTLEGDEGDRRLERLRTPWSSAAVFLVPGTTVPLPAATSPTDE